MILVPFRLLLAAAFVAAPIAAHAETIKAGNWLVDTTTDPKTQQVRVGAVLDAKAGGSTQGHSRLYARCEAGKTDAYIVWGDNLGPAPSQLILQADRAPSVMVTAQHAANDTATFLPDATSLLRALTAAGTLRAQVPTQRQGTVTAQFDLTGGVAVAYRVAEACKIDLAAAKTDLISPKGTNEVYLSFFESIVFGSEFGGGSPTVRKWTGPVRYKVAGRDARTSAVAQRFRATMQADMAELTKFSQVKFEELAGNATGDNFIIWFSDTAHMIEDARKYLAGDPHDVDRITNANCFFLSYFDARGQMLRGRVIANADLDDQELTRCLLEELTQSLGLPNDDYNVAPSLFNDGMKLTSLSIVDKALIRVLYDPRLAPGTPRAQALMIARAVLAELNPGG